MGTRTAHFRLAGLQEPIGVVVVEPCTDQLVQLWLSALRCAGKTSSARFNNVFGNASLRKYKVMASSRVKREPHEITQ